ncbi:Sec-independent protein translocase subunit TatA [Herbiconiux sp. P15]|uniref:Sec-independent protein translocase subunit TatA n=1 Tax=Herbiconiux liukaitaii TaxID=3342799 RepID=UPI0035BB0F1D
MANLTGWHLIIVLVVILLLFGATRLPALSKSLGQSLRIFRNETKAMKDESAAEKAAEANAAAAAAAPTPLPYQAESQTPATGAAPAPAPHPGSTSDTPKS